MIMQTSLLRQIKDRMSSIAMVIALYGQVITTASFSIGILPAEAATSQPPLIIAISAEYGVQGSHAAQSIEKGVRLAVDEINARGGLLGGRKIEVESRDDRGVPARAIDNVIELASRPEVIAVFCGRFSPVAIEISPVANREKILLLDPWAAADGITKNPENSFVFRLSLIDTWAIDKMLSYASSRKLTNLGVLVPNTAWGRSSMNAANSFKEKHPATRITPIWYNWGDTEFSSILKKIRDDGVQALIMVANEAEGAHVVRQMAQMPKDQRMPIISHWGIAGGDFASQVGTALSEVDLTVAQTFTFHALTSANAKKVASAYEARFKESIHKLRAQVGFAHAYDLTHLLAQSIRIANSSDRLAIRNAMEKIGKHDGLVRSYQRPFTTTNHDALGPSQVKMMRFTESGEFQAIQ